MAATFQVIALSSLDPAGLDTVREPKLTFPDALVAARDLQSQGKAFRVMVEGVCDDRQRESFRELGAIEDGG